MSQKGAIQEVFYRGVYTYIKFHKNVMLSVLSSISMLRMADKLLIRISDKVKLNGFQSTARSSTASSLSCTRLTILKYNSETSLSSLKYFTMFQSLQDLFKHLISIQQFLAWWSFHITLHTDPVKLLEQVHRAFTKKISSFFSSKCYPDLITQHLNSLFKILHSCLSS